MAETGKSCNTSARSKRASSLCLMEAFSHRLFASSSRSSLAYPRGVVGGNDVDVEMVVVVAVDTSFIFHPYPPPPCARVSAFSASLHLLPPTAASPRGAILGTPTISSSSSLFPFFPAQAPSSRSREETGTRFSLSSSSAAVSLCFSYFSSPSSAPPFCSPALSAHISLSFSLPSSFFHYFSVLTECLEYFGNYSGRFRVCFFVVPKCNILYCSYYSPFSFRPYLHSNINKCESNCEKPANEYVVTISSFYLIAFDCWSIT